MFSSCITTISAGPLLEPVAKYGWLGQKQRYNKASTRAFKLTWTPKSSLPHPLFLGALCQAYLSGHPNPSSCTYFWALCQAPKRQFPSICVVIAQLVEHLGWQADSNCRWLLKGFNGSCRSRDKNQALKYVESPQIKSRALIWGLLLKMLSVSINFAFGLFHRDT